MGCSRLRAAATCVEVTATMSPSLSQVGRQLVAARGATASFFVRVDTAALRKLPPTLYDPRVAGACDGSCAGELPLYFAAEPGLFAARRARSDRRETRLADLQSGRPHGDDAVQG